MSLTSLSRRSLPGVLILVSVLAGAGLDAVFFDSSKLAENRQAENQREPKAAGALSQDDKAHYRQAFALQRAGNFSASAAELARVNDDVIKDAVLAVRPVDKAGLSYDTGLPVVSGYSRSALPENKSWQAGIAAFRRNNMSAAAHQFRLLADTESLSREDRASAAFWAYRAFKASGKTDAARIYLEKAANSASGFYSQIAKNLMGEAAPTSASVADKQQAFEQLLDRLAVKRIVALREVDEDALAANELRLLYSRSDAPTRNQLRTLAEYLDLPAIQMQMGGGKETFPVPHWEPASGYKLDRALLFAIMRQESGFNPNARNPSGAVGLMQLMPQTVNAMRRDSHFGNKSSDPEVNIALGQHYLEHLMQTPQIGDNLIYLTASYNAGPGSVINWLNNAHNEKDPLLFVESIPYAQTRDYVEHVIANYWVYSQLLSAATPSSLEALAGGNWPHYEGAETQLVTLLSRVD